MKIAIDAFTLGFAQGTGLATYARELSYALTQVGHNVYPIYGLTGVSKNPALQWPSFIQSLYTRGEPHSLDLKSWLPTGLTYAFNALSGFSCSAQKINAENAYAAMPLKQRLPKFDVIFNCRGIYRAAQAYASFIKKPLFLELKGNRPDIFHVTMPLPISMKRVPKVVTVHDLIPLMLPHSTTVNLKRYLNILHSALRDADIIFSVSEHTKNDLVYTLRIPEEKILVTYQSTNTAKAAEKISEAETKEFLNEHYSLEYKKYFLFYGAIEPKKNVFRILEAFTKSKTDLPLVIAGKNGWLYYDVARFLRQREKDNKIRRLEYLPFNFLLHLLKGARGLIFPSLYEGFGLPVLEAMQVGCPVITSHMTSLPEVGGDAVHYVDPLSVSDITAAIDKFDADEAYLESLAQKGYAQAAKFSPEQHMLRVKEGYDRL